MRPPPRAILASLAVPFLLAACGTGQSRAPVASAALPVPAAVPVAPAAGYAAALEGESPYRPSPYFLPEIDARPEFAASSVPYTRAESYLLIDAATGRHLASRNAEVKRSVASTQKLVTALVILDAGNLDKPVRVLASDLNVEPTVLGLRAGETYTRRNLLYVMLVKSCNDVANVLARDNAGSISAFAAKMNAKARSLGCYNSSFKNPHGLTAPGQYSTARDMARVSMAAYRNPVIRDAVRRRSYTFRRNNGQMVTLKSTNDLLAFMPECNGMKTGYTNAAGRCLISTASRSGRNVILVQLGTKTKYIWDDGRILMSWGLQRARGSSFAFAP
ncbi:MAG TPA: D-alanyl-D-alanine carboxypeptidase family protein [Prosthecobacter sp.]|nr:D-alanyl-D-alanine carboxypeptidase family protein [Prosthecobacter sp.]HRK13286.1 D-alanyl-D-alanine carboxypeptidase family protein [Prosthecobacter sp.]